ncbi:MAG: hypothetical protein HUK00_03685 [Bacteroidaceae bacterium]|nr:hypothetical protein [Bacteroidaceae bacterium]
MKRSLLIIAFAMMAMVMQAQEVYKAVILSAQEVLNDTRADDMQLKAAQFKITALNYMHRKMVEKNPDTPVRELDLQAYYMSEFLTAFMTDVYRNKDKAEQVRTNRILFYISVTKSCPMFNDPNKDETDIYITEADNITPFSLDTNWEQAVELLHKNRQELENIK